MKKVYNKTVRNLHRKANTSLVHAENAKGDLVKIRRQNTDYLPFKEWVRKNGANIPISEKAFQIIQRG